MVTNLINEFLKQEVDASNSLSVIPRLIVIALISDQDRITKTKFLEALEVCEALPPYLIMLMFVLSIGRFVCVLSMLALVATRCLALGTQ